ncbi:MAG: glycoside hydrolase family 3 C-terminal domain-containing protein [Bacteroidales bacterium]|nr:glycoside hydrolase family 3 C-terminal domain-containing protein [Bacteroidales bacterium]
MYKIHLRLIPLFTILFTFSINAQLFIHDNPRKDIYHENWIDLNKNNTKDIYEDPSQPVEKRVEDLLSRMTLEEKTCQMATLYGYKRVAEDELPTEEWKNSIIKDGIGNIDEHLNGLAYHDYAKTQYSWPPSKHTRAINEVQRFFIEETRLGIPVDFTNEGIRGLCHHGATSFPAQIGVGSTWDRELVYKIGEITGREAKLLGYSNIYSPILDLARDPRWGRTVECYSEDPFLISQYGLEMVKAIQSQGVASTGKHFTVYSVPKGGRDGHVRTDPHVTEREVYEIYLEPFRTAVEEGHILGLMSSYNDYNGIPITGSHYFLTELLRNKWGFNGYVVSDSWAVGGLQGRHFVAENYKECVYQSVMAGLNIRTNFTPPHDFILPLRELVNEERIQMEIINDRVRDILRVKFVLGLFDHPYAEDPSEADKVVHNPEYEKISLEASRKSIVLLKNENNLLPLDKNAIGSILVTGPNAKAVNHSISRYGPSNIEVVSVYDGIKSLVGDEVDIQYARGCDFYDNNWPENELYEILPDSVQQAYIDEATEKAKLVDLIVVAVGDNENTVGESKSRTSLNLPGNQSDLVEALYKTGKPIVVILINGRPMTINWIDKYVPSIIEAWCPGQYGGTAIAEVLFGLYNPGGKLPITFPRAVGQIPFNFPCKKSSQKEQSGYRGGHFEKTRIDSALYPFGYGLSYTTFEYDNLEIVPAVTSPDFDSISVSFTVKNTGDYTGDEIPQLYIRDEYSSVVTYEKVLRGFDRVSLDPGEMKEISFILHPRNLQILDKDMKKVVEPGDFTIFIGSSSEDIRLREILNIQ